MENSKEFKKLVKKISTILLISMTMIFGFSVVICFLLLLNPIKTEQISIEYNHLEDEDKIENGIHVRTGFVEADGLMQTVNNCTNCHSAKLVTQNRMTKDGWIETIRWMQKTQNLWDLGGNEDIIVKYLSENYAPKKKGRREKLNAIEWYELQNE